MKVTMALLLLLAVVGMCVFTGCSGDDDDDDNDIIIPTALRGTWFVAAYDDTNAPQAGTLFEVSSAGVISDYNNVQVPSVDNGADDISGTVSPAGVTSFTAVFDGTTVTATGTLNTDDTGTGTWIARENNVVVGSGTFVACRADGGEFAGTWDVSGTGDLSGTGDFIVTSEGVILGLFDPGTGSSDLIGVINGNDDVLAIWGVDNGDPVLVAEGSATSLTEMNGTWRTNTGLTGEWEASKQ